MFKALFAFAAILGVSLALPGGRIVGGKPAELGQFPHQVLLQRQGAFTCGGSVISKDFVLTAAHCVVQYGTKPYPESAFKVVVGSVEQGVETVTRQVSKVVVNSAYGSFKNDVALLKLSEPLEFSDTVKAVELHDGTVPVGSEVTISGFGRVYNGGAVSPVLLYNTLKSVSKEDCGRASGIYYDGLLCLGHSAGNGACNGDSGGPALYNGKLVGVANFVVHGCASSYPDGYAFVPFFKDWIAENTQ